MTLLTLGVAALWSSAAGAQETVSPTPLMTDQPEQRETIRPNRPLLFAGAGVIAVSYIPAVVVASTSEHKGDDFLYIPVAGPWMDLADRGGCAPNPCSDEAVYKTMLVATGVAHLVGVGLVVSSFIVPEERTRQLARPKPVVVPTQMGAGGAGLTLIGRF